MTDIKIKQLLIDMQRNVDYAYDRGFLAGQKETAEEELKFLQNLPLMNSHDEEIKVSAEDFSMICNKIEVLKNLLAENQEENHNQLQIRCRGVTNHYGELVKSPESADIQEVCENCGKDLLEHYSGNLCNPKLGSKKFVPKKAEENKKEMGK
jgi:hypothetical protein